MDLNRHSGTADGRSFSRGAASVVALILAVLGPATASVQAAPLKQNGKIAFVAFRDGDPEVYTMRSDGTQPVRLTNNAGPTPDLPALDFWPSWSPDGAEIVFTSFQLQGMNLDVFTMNGDGSAKTRITRHPAGDLDPAFTPDKKKIVFVRELPIPDPDHPMQDIYIVNADGTGETNLTKSAENETEPAVSPDGTKIVFEREVAPENHEIFTMNIDGTGVRRLTSTATAEGHPGFSPDGTRIIYDDNFHAPPAVRGAIHTMKPDGSDVRTLTANRTDRHGLASYSPDGTKITFTASEDIWVMNADGSGQHPLTNHPTPDIQSSWQPLPRFAGCSLSATNVISGTSAGDRIAGTVAADRILAGGGRDRVVGLAANDCIDLGRGADRGRGGPGKDLIVGGGGGDVIAGGAGNDRLSGQSGADRISGGPGRDRIKGGTGNDRIRSRDGRRDRVNCGSGRDSAVVDRGDRVAHCELVSRPR